jgi:glyoxylase-like metal-dependent hydrolase (beta-lactamase superfamily II)
LYFEQFIDERLGCLSYMVACPSEMTAAVVDPYLPPERYLETAARHGMRIDHVLETHIHADHLSTGPELARQAGAAYLLHTRAPYQGRFDGLNEGDRLRVGKVALRVVHTPGHTPESLSLAASDLRRTEEPWFLLTGDTLFVGDVGRPDGHVHGRKAAAEQLYGSVHRLLDLFDDHLEVFPAHYAGSACGRYLSPKPSSTVGFERRHNLGLKGGTLAAFLEHAAGDLPPIEGMVENLRHNRGEDARVVAP